MPVRTLVHQLVPVAVFAATVVLGLPAAAESNPCNPCAGSNPCASANPCGGANPCGVANPCAGANPCAANACNPCAGGAGVDPSRFQRPEGLRTGGGDREELVRQGEKLWNDSSLSTNGAACATCHANYAAFLTSFAKPYPHEVGMVKAQSGVGEIDAAEMVQFCMIKPMQAEPLSWSSSQLAALTAYVEDLQGGFEPNPCAAGSAANPCNPCGGGAANPCNPCGGGASNPCNPCGGGS